MHFVRSYRRPSDGVRVRGHWRRSSSTSTGLGITGILGIVAALALFPPNGHFSGGSGAAPSARDTEVSSSSRLEEGGRIVQVSSHRDAGLAAAEAVQLRQRGLTAGVLLSERYRPYQSGYHVVYVGPCPSTAAGSADADRVASTLPGSLVREVHAR
jgi:hypothetical protein